MNQCAVRCHFAALDNSGLAWGLGTLAVIAAFVFAAVPFFSFTVIAVSVLTVAFLPLLGSERIFEDLPLTGLFICPRAHADFVERVRF